MTPPPCRCGVEATGFVVEGHLHPYCAWRASEARADALRAAIAAERFTAGCCDQCDRMLAALAADREGRLS